MFENAMKILGLLGELVNTTVDSGVSLILIILVVVIGFSMGSWFVRVLKKLVK